MNTIQDMIKAIKNLQQRVDSLEAKQTAPKPLPDIPKELESVTRRGRPRRALEGEDVI